MLKEEPFALTALPFECPDCGKTGDEEDFVFLNTCLNEDCGEVFVEDAGCTSCDSDIEDSEGLGLGCEYCLCEVVGGGLTNFFLLPADEKTK